MKRNEYDLRQLGLMQEFIGKYESGKSSLGDLVSNLEALQSVLEGESSSFNDDFSSLWGRLEDTYAFMLDEERPTANEVDNRIVAEALDGLKSLISSELASD